MVSEPTGHIFISYSRKDDEVMRRIAFHLRDLKLKVWVDHEKLVPGTPAWEGSIEKAIKNAYAVIALLSPEAKDSEWVRREIAYADQYQKRIFPVFVRGDDDSALPIRLITRQFIDFRRDENQGLNELSEALRFFIEKKQTLEMKRPPAQQETSAAHPSPTSPQKTSTATKWILSAGIFFAICILALGAVWIGYRVLSPSTSSTQPDNVAVIPTTSLSTETPDQSLADTSTPDISTPEPSTVAEPGNPLDYLNDVQVVQTDTFDDSLADKWNVTNGTLDNGTLKIIGNNNYDGVFRNRDFGEGEGIIIDFNYSQDAKFELLMDRGDYNSDAYKRFGIFIESNVVSVNERGGGNTNGSGFSGNLILEPDKTYSLFIAILPDAEFMQVIWDPSDPSKSLSYREAMNQAWSGINWTFYIQAGSGTIHFDNFREITFSGAK